MPWLWGRPSGGTPALATALFRGSLSGGRAEVGGSEVLRIPHAPPMPPFPWAPTYPAVPQHRGVVWGRGRGWQGLTCAAAGGPPGEPLAQLHLHAAHEPVDVLGGAVARLLQQVSERPGRGRGTSGRALLPASSLPSRCPPARPTPRAAGPFQSGEDPEEGMGEGCSCCCGEEAAQVALAHALLFATPSRYAPA